MFARIPYSQLFDYELTYTEQEQFLLTGQATQLWQLKAAMQHYGQQRSLDLIASRDAAISAEVSVKLGDNYSPTKDAFRNDTLSLAFPTSYPLKEELARMKREYNQRKAHAEPK